MSNNTTKTPPVPIDQLTTEFPELRVHLAHLRALHQQRLAGTNDPVLPRLRGATVNPDELIPVTIRLSPTVVEAFRATGKGWRKQINQVLMSLVGKETK